MLLLANAEFEECAGCGRISWHYTKALLLRSVRLKKKCLAGADRRRNKELEQWINGKRTKEQARKRLSCLSGEKGAV